MLRYRTLRLIAFLLRAPKTVLTESLLVDEIDGSTLDPLWRLLVPTKYIKRTWSY